MHSTFSDGDYSPAELVVMAKEKGLDIISITDHNTIDGVEEAINRGELETVKVIPGIELSTRFRGKKVHVLGYFNEKILKNSNFRKALEYVKKSDILSLQQLLGFEVKLDEESVKNKIHTNSGIKLLKHFGGVVVLAHPIKIKNEIINDILKLDFHGIEAVYWKNSKTDSEYFMSLARRKGCFYTAGSDFHSDKRVDKRHGKLGEVFINKEEIDNFINKIS
ncbi:PHP domain-containing protein [Clostridium sp. 'White wine YQ']|uniref:PHP domain-containing protein n=1 Tax=Clostridium sp. 'White wine YQ' TaxID=3027474 RepID=UPI002365B4A8|nr:PHP domain-containing protein [Clostridium sp. 'White wine YQ']MDD7794716.1 PHP domain-containing protein [Clostridium sp. 'White wine YQ']